MSNYLWHHIGDGEARPQICIVLAWHEGRATVVDCDERGDPIIGDPPYLVSYAYLKLGRPLEAPIPA